MSQTTPYTYYACACSGTPAFATSQQPRKAPDSIEDDDEQQTFDPTSSRANYSLYPLERLLYCTDCHEARCPRCITEEVVCWYCPTCLFEVPSSTVRSEGNRCSRNCYNCPLCTSNLTINSVEPPSNEDREPSGPFILSCPWCNWSSLQIDLMFEKATNITGQLQRWRAARRGEQANKERQLTQAERILLRSEGNSTVVSPLPDDAKQLALEDARSTKREAPDAEDLFISLNAFYKQQIADTSEGYTGLGASDLSFASPSSINRLLNLYSAAGKRAKKAKPKEMREALSMDEGYLPFDAEVEDRALARLHREGVDNLATTEQQQFQDKRHDARFTNDLLPVASLFRQKRIKRCRVCRQLLSRPEPKINSTRYKFKLLALSHIPKVSLWPLSITPSLGASTSSIANQPAVAGSTKSSQPGGTASAISLTPLKTHTFILTLTNPIFEPLRVTLATPGITPGPVQSRVTILCPQFEVGSNTDIWDEALTGPASSTGGASSSASRDARRKGQVSSSTTQDDQRVAEAGKIWDQGRNWTSVVVEVVPGLLPGSVGYAPGGLSESKTAKRRDAAYLSNDYHESDTESDEEFDTEADSVLEIPIFVRIEYEVEAVADDEGAGTGAGARVTSVATALTSGGNTAMTSTVKDSKEKEKRELAFWCVLGAGTIAR